MNNDNIKQFILQLSSEAGEFLRNNFYSFKNILQRRSGEKVTNIDIELQAILQRRITQEFPDHGLIFPDESHNTTSEWVWIVDPLDGGKHFYRNIPIYSVNIAVQHKGKTVFAAVNAAQSHQLFFAQRGKGALLNGIEMSVSEQSDISQSYIFIELPSRTLLQQHPALFEERMKMIGDLSKRVGRIETFRIGAFGQCLVASGAFDAYIDFSGTSEKISQVPSVLIVQESGGEVIELRTFSDEYVRFMATNGKLTKALQEVTS